MNPHVKVTYKDLGLNNILKAMKNPPTIRVGILGGSDSRGDGESNASIGARHEFGGAKLPQRSFLRVPIMDHLAKRLEEAGFISKESIKAVAKTKSVRPWFLKIAALCESIVLGAFETGGFGKWKPSNMKRKKVHMTLVETQQLRNSITSEVKD